MPILIKYLFHYFRFKFTAGQQPTMGFSPFGWGCQQELEEQKQQEEPPSPGPGGDADKAGGLTPIRSGPRKKQRFQEDEECSPPKPTALFSEPFPKDPVLEVRI